MDLINHCNHTGVFKWQDVKLYQKLASRRYGGMEGAFWKILIPAKQGASLLKLYFNLSIDLDFRVFICFTSFVGSAGFFTKGEPTFGRTICMQRSTMNYKKSEIALQDLQMKNCPD